MKTDMDGIFNRETVRTTFYMNGVVVTTDVTKSEKMALDWRDTTHSRLLGIVSEPIEDLSKLMIRRMEEQYERHYARRDAEYAAGVAAVYSGSVPDAIESTRTVFSQSERLLMGAFRNIEYNLSPFYGIGPKVMGEVLKRIEEEAVEVYREFAENTRKLGIDVENAQNGEQIDKAFIAFIDLRDDLLRKVDNDIGAPEHIRRIVDQSLRELLR